MPSLTAVKVSRSQNSWTPLPASAASRERQTHSAPRLAPRLPIVFAPARPENSRRFLKRSRPFPEAGSRPSLGSGGCYAPSCDSRCLGLSGNGVGRNMALLCYNRGCAQRFDPENNSDGKRKAPPAPPAVSCRGRLWARRSPRGSSRELSPRCPRVRVPPGPLSAAIGAASRVLCCAGAPGSAPVTASLPPPEPTDRSPPSRGRTCFSAVGSPCSAPGVEHPFIPTPLLGTQKATRCCGLA